MAVMVGNSDEYKVKRKDAEGKGISIDDGLIAKAGTRARREIVPFAISSVAAVHKQFIAEGVDVEEGVHLRFVKDHRFNSPREAAAAVLGRTANGWKEW